MKIDFFTYHMTAFNNYFLSSAHYGKSWIFDKNIATFLNNRQIDIVEFRSKMYEKFEFSCPKWR